MINGFFPADFLPWIFNIGTNHGFGYTIFMGGITKGKASLNTGVTMIGLAIFIGHHANDLLAFHFCPE